MTLLDTHTWIWWVTESLSLSAEAKRAISESEGLGVSVISCWEVGMLVAKRRLGLRTDVQDWVDQALQRQKIRLVPIDPKIAVLATRLPGDPISDPVDCLLAATCLTYGASLVSKDRRIADWGQIRVIW